MYKQAIINTLIKYANGVDYLGYAWSSYNRLNRTRKNINEIENILKILGETDKLLTSDMDRRGFFRYFTSNLRSKPPKKKAYTPPDLTASAITHNIINTINNSSVNNEATQKITRRKFIAPWLDRMYDTNKSNGIKGKAKSTAAPTTTQDAPKITRRQFLMPFANK